MTEKKSAMKIIMRFRETLSPSARAVLVKMRDADAAEKYEDAEIIKDGRFSAWLGDETVPAKIIDELLCAVLIHAEETMGAKIQRFTINGDGKKLLSSGDTRIDT